jgi:hypothetical protein
MKNIIRIVAAMVLIVGAGLVHGHWTSRWRISPALAALAARMESVPMTIGDWTATSREIPPRELAMTGAAGYIARIYSNPSKGLTVSVLLLCGLPGDIATHTPDVCYPGAGFTLEAAESYTRRYGSPERRAGFQTALARRGGANPSVLRLYWGWKGSAGWAAPEDARWSFASEPVLSKLYVVRETGGSVVDAKDDPANEFMSLLLPELDRVVFSAPGQTSGSPASAEAAAAH